RHDSRMDVLARAAFRSRRAAGTAFRVLVSPAANHRWRVLHRPHRTFSHDAHRTAVLLDDGARGEFTVLYLRRVSHRRPDDGRETSADAARRARCRPRTAHWVVRGCSVVERYPGHIPGPLSCVWAGARCDLRRAARALV